MIDVVIATYNRIDKAKELAKSILKLYSKHVNKILLVDSTEYNEPINFSEGNIIHVITRHRNQPYQRFLGYCLSDADYLIFLDDDMEITETNEIFDKTNDIFKKECNAAIAYNFSEKHQDTSLSDLPATVFKNKFAGLYKMKDLITGYPSPEVGRYGLCGIRGQKPSTDGYVEFIGGGVFSARRDSLYRNFNFQLFDLYENELGKGEDGILGYSISKQGKIFFINDIYFVHNDQRNSIYSTDVYRFARRVAYSRLYLSLEKSRLDGRSYYFAKLHYHYYMFWRIIGLLINYLLKPTSERGKMLKGFFSGWGMAFRFKFDKRLVSRTSWQSIAQSDLEINNVTVTC